jgi:hypothetical protein
MHGDAHSHRESIRRDNECENGIRSTHSKIKLQKENNMEPTITQNSALFFAHRKISKRRATLFRGLRAASSKQGPDAQRQLTCTALFVARRLHQDNGR